ncbi:UNVERIFIED_CONTAM: pantetheine-phosphate adenylyltransferase, partial [Lactobacillus paragasseri]|nr:pantetheine-phosphate adenylyltransferase [Lactobacillus paragasseri]
YLPANINEALKKRLMEREMLRVKKDNEKAR